MPNKIIIRTFDGHPLSDAVKNSVCGIASIENPIIEYKKIESIEEWQKSSAEERIKSATKAFQLICRAKQDEALATYVEVLEKDYLNRPLSEYLTRLDCLACQALNLNSIEFKNQLAIAENYVVAITEKPILATVTRDENNKYIVQMEIPKSPFNSDMLIQFENAKKNKDLPGWYQAMDADEKFLFDYVSKNNDFSVLSSKHRTVIGVANFLEHQFAILDGNGEVEYCRAPALRSSIIASHKFDVNNRKLRVGVALSNYQRIIQHNYDKIINEFSSANNGITVENVDSLLKRLSRAPILLQTLISPFNPISSMIPDPDLYRDKLEAVEIISQRGIPLTLYVDGKPVKYNIKPVNLFETNHSQNIARKVLSTNGVFDLSGTGEQLNNLKKYATAVRDEIISPSLENLETRKNTVNPRDNLKLYKQLSESRSLDIANRIIRANDKSSKLDAAIAELNDLLTLSEEYKKKSKGRRRELHLAGIEEFIMGLLPDAISHGSCVSGKDRKGLESMYVDAIHYYWHRYGILPKLNDEPLARTRFCEIFAKLYVTHHQHMSAGLNAPGANGIKAPDRYLPKDILVAIEQQLPGEVVLSNDIADTNEFDHEKFQVESDQKTRAIYKLDAIKNLHLLNNKSYYENNEVFGIVSKLIDIIKSNKWNNQAIKLYGWTTPDGIASMRLSFNGNVIFNSESALDILIGIGEIVKDREQAYNKSQYSSKHFYGLVCKILYGNIEPSDIEYLDQFHREFVPSKKTTSFKPSSR